MRNFLIDRPGNKSRLIAQEFDSIWSATEDIGYNPLDLNVIFKNPLIYLKFFI